MANIHVFTITTGRTGTAYLRKLIAANSVSAETHHEINSYRYIGVETPDLSDVVTFNTFGNTEKVRSFWRRKLDRISRCSQHVYAETSHLLAKSGLMENLDLLGQSVSIKVIDLRRNAGETLLSFVSRNDFNANGNAMLFYLQHNYRMNLVRPGQMSSSARWAAWYIAEMRVRASFYSCQFSASSNTEVVRADLNDIATAEGAANLLKKIGIIKLPSEIALPDPQNTAPPLYNVSKQEEANIRALGKQVDGIDTDSIGREIFQSGRSFQVVGVS